MSAANAGEAIGTIDHIVIVVGSLEQAADIYRRLGFTLSPKGVHSAALGTENHTIMLRNHGPLVVGGTVAEAFVRLNFLEELCGWQLHAMQTGRELQQIEPCVVEKVRRDAEAGGLAAYAKTQIAAMKRVLDRQEPDFRN